MVGVSSVCGRTVDRHIQCSIQYMIISIVNVTINISPVPFILITVEITTYSISRTQYLIEVIGCVARIGPIVLLQSSQNLHSCHSIQSMAATELFVVARI